MRNLLLSFAMLFFGITLFAQEETVSYIMNDGSVKTFKQNDIEDISTEKGKATYEMKIYLKNSVPVSYFSYQFDSVKYNRDNYNNYVYTVYSGAYQFSYLLADIDSVCYFYDSVATITNDMILIPADTFQMGNTGAYSGDSDEKPVHTVTISKAFYMSKYEVTQKQYQAVMGNNPSHFKGENLPVERVTWYNAVAFCNALSQQEGKTPCYTINGTNVSCNWDANGYRLPTEAEWEYAAKAGTSTDFYNGSLTNTNCTPIDANLDNIAWYCGNANGTTHPVGQKQANAFGLYDMTGNVCEWCWDWWSNSYSSTTVIDPTGASTGSYRVYRGGSWYGNADQCRSTYREYRTPSFNYDYIGFRIVRVGNQCQSGFDCYLKENLPTD